MVGVKCRLISGVGLVEGGMELTVLIESPQKRTELNKILGIEDSIVVSRDIY